MFNLLHRYLHDEPVNFISVSTARATLDAAHQYLCPGLAQLAVEYLQNHLTPSTVLEIYQGLGLYANDQREGEERSSSDRSSSSPTVPLSPGDDAGAIGMCGFSSCDYIQFSLQITSKIVNKYSIQLLFALITRE